jgi:piezo-type mechanosensitive ion channel component 1/2
VLFKGFLLVPFLLELRALMDWMFTDTSLSLNDWLQMEDIYANIFVLKCFRWAETKYPTFIGSKRKAFVKYGFGGFLLVVIILIIWFPLLLFSFSEGFNRSVPPSSCSIDIQIGGYLPIYSATSQQRLLTRFTKQNFDDLKKAAPEAYNFLKDYTLDDIYCVDIPGNSTSTWQISPASLANMKLDLASEDEMKLYFLYSITRESSEQQNEVLSEKVSGMRQIDLNNSTLRMIYEVLLNQNTNPM